MAGVAVVRTPLTALRRPADRELGAAPDLRQPAACCFPLATRALPLLLLFITFLFINAEVWQVDLGDLDGGVLWLSRAVLRRSRSAFLLVRLPEEVDRVDDDVDDDASARRLPRHPARAAPRGELVDDPAPTPGAYAEVTGCERWNLMLVLLIIQAVQVLLLARRGVRFFLRLRRRRDQDR